MQHYIAQRTNTSTPWIAVSGLVAPPAHPLSHLLLFVAERGLLAGAAAAARAPPALTDMRHRVKAHGHCHMVVGQQLEHHGPSGVLETRPLGFRRQAVKDARAVWH